jgi:hypothetical protein
MASLAPKTTESGGISPRGWINELTGFEVLIIVRASASRGLWSDVHPENQTTQGEQTPIPTRLTYLLEEKQLTKDQVRLPPVIIKSSLTVQSTPQVEENIFTRKK